MKFSMKSSLLFLLPIFLFSCQQNDRKAADNKSEPIVKQNSKEQKSKPINKQTGDTIVMKFRNEEGLLIAEGSLDTIYSRLYVTFMNENPVELKARIIPAEGKANIRFSKIIFPDKTSDGPFGMDFQIPLNQKGKHILVIGHSLMAENPYFGTFRVELENK